MKNILFSSVAIISIIFLFGLQPVFGEFSYYCDSKKIDAEWLVFEHKTNEIEMAIDSYLEENPLASNYEVENYLLNETDLQLWYALRNCIESYGINPEMVSSPGELMRKYLMIEKSTVSEDFEIPDWIKKTAVIWAHDPSKSYGFVNAISFLSKTNSWEGLSPLQFADGSSPDIPEWIRYIVIWWTEEKISDKEMINSISYLTDKKIIKI